MEGEILAGLFVARTDEHGKRLADQELTDGIEIREDERATIRLAEPFAALAPEPASSDVRCSSTSLIVGLRREFENPCQPPLKTLSLRRSRGFYK